MVLKKEVALIVPFFTKVLLYVSLNKYAVPETT